MRTRTNRRTRYSERSSDEGVDSAPATGPRGPVTPKTEQYSVERAFIEGLRTGDTFTLTSGAEVYPYEGGSVTVGPITATITVMKNEPPDEAYLRARNLVECLFQAEFDLKTKMYKARRKDV